MFPRAGAAASPAPHSSGDTPQRPLAAATAPLHEQSLSNLGRKVIARDQLIVPEVATDSLDLDEAQFMALMRRLLDPVWNACGWAGSHNFDAEGRWKH